MTAVPSTDLCTTLSDHRNLKGNMNDSDASAPGDDIGILVNGMHHSLSFERSRHDII